MAQARAPRRDGAANRERLLSVAHDLFAERGPGIPLEEVARAAGVSRTTLYRNFTSREELAAKVYDTNVTRIEEHSDRLRGTRDGVIRLFDTVLDMQQENRSLTQVLGGDDIPWLTDLSARTEAAFEPLLTTSQHAGLVRPGVEIDDLMLAFPMFAGALGDPDRPGRERKIHRVRTMLHQALFCPPNGLATTPIHRGTSRKSRRVTNDKESAVKSKTAGCRGIQSEGVSPISGV